MSTDVMISVSQVSDEHLVRWLRKVLGAQMECVFETTDCRLYSAGTDSVLVSSTDGSHSLTFTFDRIPGSKLDFARDAARELATRIGAYLEDRTVDVSPSGESELTIETLLASPAYTGPLREVIPAFARPEMTATET